MHAPRHLLATAVLLISVAACSGAPSRTADQIVSELTSKVATAQPSVAFTADTDPNKLLGRPNGYTSKMSFADSRIDSDDPIGVEPGSVDAGGSVEEAFTAGVLGRGADIIGRD